MCGRDGKTYSSSCHARRAGVKVAFGRACNALGGGKNHDAVLTVVMTCDNVPHVTIAGY